ncbi:DUF7146 domain-containing protein [Xanthobacter flavus]|uniref:DUF7146 domain-containing protein n=1 Tax=Xanthobacter flavus TaxID=281 RepID=UPI00372BC0B0
MTAALSLSQLARVLGGDVAGAQVLAPGPGHSPKDRSLSVRLATSAPDGFVVHSHCGDDWQACRDHVAERLGIRREFEPRRTEPVTAPRRVEHPRTELITGDDDAAQRIATALRIWDEAVNPRGTVVDAYLRSRGLAIEDGMAGVVLRLHSALRFESGTMPGMMGLYRDIRTDEPCGIHRTFLGPDGQKLGRKMLGRAKGAAIKLDGDDTVTLGLTIGEGIETALSGRIAGFRPAWALGSAGAIADFPVLPGVECLTILGETDDTGANERAVRICARRWLNAGVEVQVIRPRRRGDLNDVLQGGLR